MPGFFEIEKKPLDWHISCLKTLRNDIIKEEKDGLKIERAIDFSDLFVYMYPEKMSQVWVPTPIIQFMFKTWYRFILLPPATWELLMYIKKNGEYYQRMMEDIDYKMFINNPYVKKFMEAVPKGRPEEIEKTYMEMEENCSLIGFLMRGGTRGWIGAPFARLSKLIREGRLVPANRLVNLVNLRESGCNEDIFNRVLDILNTRRDAKSYEEPNIVDAHNFAIVYSLNEVYGKRRYFTVTTSSSIPSYAYEQVRWKGEILNRNPIDVLYYTEAKHNNIPIEKIDECIRANETLRDIRGRDTTI
ncbi:TPA: hypothetical protein DCX16_01915 [bacterium]|nr:hypothetical protein [bacterium]